MVPLAVTKKRGSTRWLGGFQCQGSGYRGYMVNLKLKLKDVFGSQYHLEEAKHKSALG